MSGFVSGGTIDKPTERDEAWLKAQQEVEARHLAKLDAGKQDDGKSLYETLQANKAAKQEAFEESIRLKNQFRTLDEDEVDFLESVLESSRAKEAQNEREDRQQLAVFKTRRDDAERAGKQIDDEPPAEAVETWQTSSRKRKMKHDTFSGIRKRYANPTVAKQSTIESAQTQSGSPSTEPDLKTRDVPAVGDETDNKAEAKQSSTSPPKKPAVVVSGYSSSEDDS